MDYPKRIVQIIDKMFWIETFVCYLRIHLGFLVGKLRPLDCFSV